MWPDQKAHGPFGELSSHCAQDVTKGWSAGYFETMRRRQAGQEAGLPLKKHHLVPVTWRKGEFALCPSAQASRARVTLSCAKGRPPLTLRLARDHPYDPDLVRSIRLQEEAGDLFVDITAWVGVIDARTDPELAAGVDPGIIHPLSPWRWARPLSWSRGVPSGPRSSCTSRTRRPGTGPSRRREPR